MFWNRVKQIVAKDAERLIEKEAFVIDVRRPRDFEKSHIKGAVSLSNDRVHEGVSELDKSRPIICYCYRGFSSRAACKNLIKAGFTKVFNLKGGYAAWTRYRKEE